MRQRTPSSCTAFAGVGEDRTEKRSIATRFAHETGSELQDCAQNLDAFVYAAGLVFEEADPYGFLIRGSAGNGA
jgi:hypothetical protein